MPAKLLEFGVASAVQIFGSKNLGLWSLVALLCATSAPAHAFDLFGLFKSNSSQQSAAVLDIENPVNYSVEINTSDPTLYDALRSSSVLIKEQATPAAGTTGLVTRAKIDQKRLLAALYGEAHYGGTIQILINGQNIEDVSLERQLSGTSPNIEISVSAGPRFTFARPDARSPNGPIDLSQFGITAGAAAKSSLIINAETKLVGDWRQKGYPFARIEKRTIEADHSTRQLEVSLWFNPGDKAAFGQIVVTGNETVNSSFIAEQADIIAGSTYSPDQIKRATKRLQEVGVFDSVVVSTAERPSADGSVAVTIEVSERKPRTIGFGVTAENFEGFGVEGFWKHRNLFGNAESLRAEASIGRIGQGGFGDLDYHADLLFKKPNAIGPATSFEARATFNIANTNAFNKRSGKISASLSNDLRDDLTVKGGIAAEYAVVDDGTTVSNTALLSTPISLTYDTRNNALNPTGGWFVTLSTEPTYVHPSHATFVKSSVEASTYLALDEDERLVLAARAAMGTIIGTDIANVPTDRRFFAGGGGSIRGYGFQMAGPLTGGGKPQGGLSYLEASAEARYKVTDDIGVVGFIDTGGAFTSNIPGQGGSLFTGVGGGVRYYTPIGPIRADIAFPLNKIAGQPQYGLYLGIGQAF